ncbi:chemotaxis protein cheR [Rhodovulum sulfidophilum]|uniref:Chemotaxis protein cheR n=1 Tax=Rhodovulum sulfidophilum TaxID=35806 RepID=A0A0D6AWW0_RHOSU|nr:chemotaxis protein cheR [Rhodovulum sulfidophilum]
MSASSLAPMQTGRAENGDRIDDKSFSRIAALVNRQTGIRLPPSKRTMVEAMLARRGRPCRLKLWSAASSIGAEAYTIAMVLAEAAARGPGFDFTVLGTDISTAVLARARMAIYPTGFAAPVPEPMRRRYFMAARDPARQELRVMPELRARVSFARLNLMDAHYGVDADFDAIFLRNVLIYFEREVQIAVVGRLIRHIRPDGFLFLGHSESSVGSELPLRQLAPATFQVL